MDPAGAEAYGVGVCVGGRVNGGGAGTPQTQSAFITVLSAQSVPAHEEVPLPLLPLPLPLPPVPATFIAAVILPQSPQSAQSVQRERRRLGQPLLPGSKPRPRKVG